MPTDDAGKLLERAAGRPVRDLDVDALWDAGRARRRAKRAIPAVVAALGVVAVAVVGSPWSAAPSGPTISPASQAPADREVPTSRPALTVRERDVTVLAAASTDDPSLKGHVVVDESGLVAVWQMAEVDGDPPPLADGAAALVVFDRETRSTCHATADVAGVEITSDGIARVLLQPLATGMCSAGEAREGFTAYVVAIPLSIGSDLSGADVRRLAAASGPAQRTLFADVADVPVTDSSRPSIAATEGAIAVGSDLLVPGAGGWWLADGVLPVPTDLLVAGDPESGWVVSVSGTGRSDGRTRVTLVRHGQTVPIDTEPDEFAGGVTAVEWHGDRFVFVARPHETSTDLWTPVLTLDPASGRWAAMPGLPTVATWSWATSLVTDGTRLTAIVGGVAFAWSGPDGEWQPEEAPSLDGTAFDVTAVGGLGVLVAVDYDGRAAIREGAQWSEPINTGLAPSECPPTLTAAGGSVFVAKCWEAAILELPNRRWRTFELAPETELAAVSSIDGGFVVATSTGEGNQPLQMVTPDE